MDWFLVPTRLEHMPCLSFRRVLTTWKTSTIFSFSALSRRFHRAQKAPEREEPSLREHKGKQTSEELQWQTESPANIYASLIETCQDPILRGTSVTSLTGREQSWVW